MDLTTVLPCRYGTVLDVTTMKRHQVKVIPGMSQRWSGCRTASCWALYHCQHEWQGDHHFLCPSKLYCIRPTVGQSDINSRLVRPLDSMFWSSESYLHLVERSVQYESSREFPYFNPRCRAGCLVWYAPVEHYYSSYESHVNGRAARHNSNYLTLSLFGNSNFQNLPNHVYVLYLLTFTNIEMLPSSLHPFLFSRDGDSRKRSPEVH